MLSPRWCNGLACSSGARQIVGLSYGRIKTKICYWMLLPSLATLKSKNKDWLGQSIYYVSVWGQHFYLRTVVSVCQHYKNLTSWAGTKRTSLSSPRIQLVLAMTQLKSACLALNNKRSLNLDGPLQNINLFYLAIPTFTVNQTMHFPKAMQFYPCVRYITVWIFLYLKSLQQRYG